VCKDYHSILKYPQFDIPNFDTVMEEMCQYCLIAFYHNQFLLQFTNILTYTRISYACKNFMVGNIEMKIAQQMYCILMVLVLSS